MSPRNVSSREAGEFVIKKLTGSGFEAVFAGGCVRDILLGAPPKDFDVATNAKPDDVAGIFRRVEMVGAKFGVALVRLKGKQIEVATYRADGAYSDGRRPDSVTFGDQRADAMRRDFTINGMYLDIATGQIIDHVGGRADLDRRVLRAIGDPHARFTEDHLRMLRAIRFAARLRFDVEPGTWSALCDDAHHLVTISSERIREELKLMMADATRAIAWRMMTESRLSKYLIEGCDFSSGEIATRIEALPERTPFATTLAALFIGAPIESVESTLRHLTCSNTEISDATWLLKNLPKAKGPESLELADVKFFIARGLADELLALLRADAVASGQPPTAEAALRPRIAAIPQPEAAPPPLVRGDDLIERKIPAGPDYAKLLDRLYREQLNEELKDRKEALQRLDVLIKG